MKEVVKNKGMICFILFMVGISYMNSIQMKEVMRNDIKQPQEISMNQN